MTIHAVFAFVPFSFQACRKYRQNRQRSIPYLIKKGNDPRYFKKMPQLLKEAFKWKLGRVLCVFVMMIYPSKTHCVPGKEWQITSGVQDEEGANTYTTAYINVSYVDPATKRFYVEKSEIGKYGDGRIGPAEGVLVHVSSEDGDHTGCQAPLRNSWGDGSLPKEPWIALIKRGQCSFEIKIENAYRHNATAVLVYNDRESPILDKMKLNSAKSATSKCNPRFFLVPKDSRRTTGARLHNMSILPARRLPPGAEEIRAEWETEIELAHSTSPWFSRLSKPVLLPFTAEYADQLPADRASARLPRHSDTSKWSVATNFDDIGLVL